MILIEVVPLLGILLTFAESYVIPQESPEKWYLVAQKDLNFALNFKEDRSAIAKNVLFYVGDGMGITTITAARIFKGQREDGVSGEEGYLSWERFPHLALLKTYNTDRQVK